MVHRNIFLLTCLTVISAVSQTTPRGISPEEVARLREEYSGLNGQIFYLNGNPQLGRALDEVPNRVPVIREELVRLVRQAVTRLLSSSQPTEGQARELINSVQGDFAFGGWDGTNTPFAHLFTLNGYPCFAAGYAILEGGAGIPDSHSFLDFYVKRNGQWNFQAVTGSDFEASTFLVSSLPAGLAGEAWFLAWGFHIGNTGTALAVRLYAFNGDQARVVWKRDDLVRGDVQVAGDAVTLNYDKEYRPLEHVERIHEVLHVTPDGLQ